jgi:3-hydroxyacyl-[acyl-carrier-protein] dehydratase
MRFVFVDRILALDPGRAITTLKNVSATEDIFDDHFPGCPIFPGALIIETFEQATELLIGLSTGFARVGRLERISRAAFRRFVRPGDQLRVRCERREGDGPAWTVAASAEVDGRPAATALLEFGLEDAMSGEPHARADRLRELARVLREGPLELAGIESSG